MMGFVRDDGGRDGFVARLIGRAGPRVHSLTQAAFHVKPGGNAKGNQPARRRLPQGAISRERQ